LASTPHNQATSTQHVVADQGEVFALLGDLNTHGLDQPVTRIDTHGAAVFLAGQNAYKVKRAVRFPFLDYSTLEKRRIACEAEVAINRANAPALYLGTVPIKRGPNGLTLNGEGEIVEWAVHMRRFDLAATFDRVAAKGGLSRALVAKLTRAVLASHARAPLRGAGPAVSALERYIGDNEAAFRATPKLFPADRVRRLTETAREALEAMKPLLLARGEHGFVRRCHGDLHLRNLVLLGGEPTLFDAIEFDDAVATGDILYDLAFLLMDLWERRLHEVANFILNRYLWDSDEANLTGLAALPLFLAIRASIRAVVVAAGLPHLGSREREHAAREAMQYFECAEKFLKPAQVRILAVGGLSGTGKSTLAAALAPHFGPAPGAIHLRSDIERKRIFGVAETEPLPVEAYRPEMAAEVYGRILSQAASAARSGYSVIVDAVHARQEERERIEMLSQQLDVPFTGLWLEVPTSILLERVTARRGDASDADASVVNKQAAYDIGAISWIRMNGAGSSTETIEIARALLGIDGYAV
jgi:aminoglycoside phosphotransferase family enzyme/predicted kinase